MRVCAHEDVGICVKCSQPHGFYKAAGNHKFYQFISNVSHIDLRSASEDSLAQFAVLNK